MSIPESLHGYAVEPSGTVHLRYADHARGFPRTRSAIGVLNLTHGDPVICRECWPLPKREAPKRVYVPAVRVSAPPVEAESKAEEAS